MNFNDCVNARLIEYIQQVSQTCWTTVIDFPSHLFEIFRVFWFWYWLSLQENLSVLGEVFWKSENQKAIAVLLWRVLANAFCLERIWYLCVKRERRSTFLTLKERRRFLSLAEIFEWVLKIGLFVINLMRLYLDLFSRNTKSNSRFTLTRW